MIHIIKIRVPADGVPRKLIVASVQSQERAQLLAAKLNQRACIFGYEPSYRVAREGEEDLEPKQRKRRPRQGRGQATRGEA